MEEEEEDDDLEEEEEEEEGEKRREAERQRFVFTPPGFQDTSLYVLCPPPLPAAPELLLSFCEDVILCVLDKTSS